MIKGNKREALTLKSILGKISDYDIFKFYMTNKFTVNEVALSPFRKEDNPSFLISNKGGGLHFIDFSDTDKKGDCVKFVQCLHNCDFNSALQMIDKDFGLGLSSSPVKDYKKTISEYSQPEDSGKRYSLIQVKTRKFTKEELSYWNDYHQSVEDLIEENIYSIDKVYLNRQLFPLKQTELRFGYFYDGHWKIYRPFSDPKQKWMPNNVPMTMMDGKTRLSKDHTAFINKSKKDYMVVKKIYPYSCAVQNEGKGCFSEENINFIKNHSKDQILSFDSDSVGVKNSQVITEEYDFDYFNVPRSYLSDGIKDWALLSKEYGMKAVEKQFKKKGLI
jgi:hypothetical protein